MNIEIERACERLLYDYAWTQDQGDPEAFAWLFTADARWLRPAREPIVGRAAILDCARGFFAVPAHGNAVVHVITNLRIVASGEEPGSTCYSTAFVDTPERRRAGLSLHARSVMIYRNRFRLEDGEWRIAEHATQLVIDF